MYLKLFKILKKKLTNISDVKLVEWFNDQYAGTIHAEPGIFIEFPAPVPMQTTQKMAQIGDVVIRIHTFSKLVPQQNKQFDESYIQKHFDIVADVFKLLHARQLIEEIWSEATETEDAVLLNTIKHTNSLQRIEINHHQYMQGWFVTTQDFSTTVFLKDTEIKHRKPHALINAAIQS